MKYLRCSSSSVWAGQQPRPEETVIVCPDRVFVRTHDLQLGHPAPCLLETRVYSGQMARPRPPRRHDNSRYNVMFHHHH